MIRSLQRKFVVINMTIVTVMLLVIFGTVLHLTQRSLEDQTGRFMQSVLSGGMNTALAPLLPGGRAESRPGTPSNPSRVQLPYIYAAVNAFGEVSLVRSGYFDVSDGEALQELILQALRAEADTGILKQYNLRFARRATAFGQAVVFVDMSNETETMRALVGTCLIIGAVSFSLFLGVSFLLARWAVRPVEKAWEEQRQFVADASHELKTPLTVIMTNAELLTDPGYGEAQREKCAGSILTMSRQMRRLVESLLELARADNGAARMEFTRLDLGALAAEAALPFEPIFFERGLTLETNTGEGLFVRGSAAHLRQAVDILLDNAAKYSAPGGAVTLEVRRQGNHCLLSVASPGEELSREELKNIFRRFYRADKARTASGSYGLGLPIARSIAAEHGGRIWAESGNGGNTFFIQLPAV